MRRLLIGDLRRIFRHRYGATLPDDDAGRDDLELLLRLSRSVAKGSGREDAISDRDPCALDARY